MLNITISSSRPTKVQIEAANIEELELYNSVLQKVAETVKDAKKSSTGIYTLFLTRICCEKIKCIKAVKESLNLGLKEAKDLVDEVSYGKEALLTSSQDIEYLRTVKRHIEETGSICKLIQKND